MKVLYQWAVNKPSDWQEIDSANWHGLPKKKDPVGGENINGKPGWINRICVQGVEFTADHYAVEEIPGSGCRVTAWSDDPEDYTEGYKNAKVCEFLPLAHDPNMGGAINTRQKITYYVQSEVRKLMPEKIQGVEVKSWDEFVLPPENSIRHGTWLEERLYWNHEKVRRQAGWREWTEGVCNSELDDNGKVKCQRDQGRYIVPSGTRTYYYNATQLLTGTHAIGSDREYELGTSPAGATDIISERIRGNESILIFVGTTPANEPDHLLWPTGEYRFQIDCTSIGLDITYGLLTLGTADGHFARVNSALTTEVETHQQAESAFAGTGLKLATYNGPWNNSGAQTDRFEVLIAAQRAANHGNQFVTLQLGETDDFADGPWTAAAVPTHNALLFGSNF